jgi:hypothetical protein
LLAGGSSNTNIFGGSAFNAGGSATAVGDASKSGDQGSASAPKPSCTSVSQRHFHESHSRMFQSSLIRRALRPRLLLVGSNFILSQFS